MDNLKVKFSSSLIDVKSSEIILIIDSLNDLYLDDWIKVQALCDELTKERKRHIRTDYISPGQKIKMPRE